MRNLIAVTDITPTGEPIRKGPTINGEQFILPVTYHLADGTTKLCQLETRRKKDMARSLERNQRLAKEGCMDAEFYESGGWGTVTRWSIR